MGWRRTLAVAMTVGSTLVAAPAAMAAGEPTASVGSPFNVTWSGATLAGTVNPGSAQTTYRFEWDVAGSSFCNATSDVASHVEPSHQLSAGGGAVGVSQAITGLTGKTTYCFRLVASSTLGSVTTARATFVTPPMPPETVIFARPAGVITKRSVEIGFNSTAAAATFECKLDVGAWAACESPTVLEGLADGMHRFEVRSTDEDGVTDPTPAFTEFRVAAPTGGTGGPTPGTSGGGTPAGPGVTDPVPVAAAPKVARAGRAKLKGSKLTTGQKVTCAGAGEACRVTVKLLASAKGSKKLVSVGSGKATVAAGGTRAIAVKLNAKGRKLLKKAGALKVISTVTVKRGTRIPVTSGVKFNVKKRK